MPTKRKIIIFLSIFMIIFLIFFVFLGMKNDDAGSKKLKNTEQSKETAKPENEVLKNVDIKLYGTNIQFAEEIQYKEVQKIDSSVFESPKKYVYLIINNLDGKFKLSDKQLRHLKKMMDDNANYNMIYLGKEFEQLIKVGFLEEHDDTNDYSFGYVMSSGFRMEYRGIWCKEDEDEKEKFPYALGEAIIFSVEYCVKNCDESADEFLSHFFEEE